VDGSKLGALDFANHVVLLHDLRDRIQALTSILEDKAKQLKTACKCYRDKDRAD